MKKITKTSIYCLDKKDNEIKTSKENSLITLNPRKKYKLKSIKKSTEISLILLGATGDGKSQLGNFILNDPNAFKVSDDIYSETKETKGKYGINGAENLFVIDTPGLQDTEGKDKEILQQMGDYIKNHKSLHAIIIVLNFEIDRLSSYIQEMIKIFVNMFPIPNFWNHVSFVFTHYYAGMIKKNEKKKNDKIEKFSELIIELMNNFKNIAKDIEIPKKADLRFFFVDTEMENLEEKDKNSIEEINRLVGWASSLETFETEKIEKVDNKVVSERYETKTRKINSKFNKNIETVYYVEEKRKIEKLYCGKESYGPWEELRKFSKDIYHIPTLIKTERKEKVEKSSTFFLNIEYITKKHYYKKISVYNDDTTKESAWLLDHIESDKIVHPKQLKKTETEYKKTFDQETNQSETVTIYYTYIWSRMKKTYNDLSIDYSPWTIINTLKQVVKRPPKVVKNVIEFTTKIDYVPIIEKCSEEVFDYLLIFVPIYKTVYYDKTIGRKVIKKQYTRKVTYYSDGTINYGDWFYYNTEFDYQYY